MAISKANAVSIRAGIAHLNLEDDPTTGGCSVNALYIGGYDPKSSAHQLLRLTVAYLDRELKQLSNPEVALHHNDGSRTTLPIPLMG